jgi:transcriptional regulator with XRE-family HTH domain
MMDPYAAERARLLKVFGEKLRAERERLDLSQREFAAITGLHRNEIGYLERGEQEPYLLTLLVLADALRVPLKDLTEGVPAPRERRPARYRAKERDARA